MLPFFLFFFFFSFLASTCRWRQSHAVANASCSSSRYSASKQWRLSPRQQDHHLHHSPRSFHLVSVSRRGRMFAPKYAILVWEAFADHDVLSRRLARRGGVKRISAGIYNDIRAVLKDRLTMVSGPPLTLHSPWQGPNEPRIPGTPVLISKYRSFETVSLMWSIGRRRPSLFMMLVYASSQPNAPPRHPSPTHFKGKISHYWHSGRSFTP